MAKISQAKIENIIDKAILQKEERAINILRNVPFKHESIERIHSFYEDITQDGELEDFDKKMLDFAHEKEQERYIDAVKALEEAVQRDVKSLEDLCIRFLNIDENTPTQKIIDKLHIYKKIGPKGKPELAKIDD